LDRDYVFNCTITWPVEINRRYAASAEIRELILGRSLRYDDGGACEGIVDEIDCPA